MTPRTALGIATLICAITLAGCHTASPNRPHVASHFEAPIRAVLDQQVRDWNDGRIDLFMRGYAPTSTTRFASGGDVQLGWETVLARYQGRYTNRAAMGHLTFSDLDITSTGPDAALVFGRWRLDREKDTPTGLFTLLLRHTPDGWRIVHDHTSSAP